MDRKLVVICVLLAIFAVMVISGCTSGPANPTVTNPAVTSKAGINVSQMPSASPGTYAGAGGFAQNASYNASLTNAPGMTGSNNTTGVIGVIGSNNTTQKK